VSDKRKILVIDDDPDIVTFLTTLMEDNGYDHVSAGNGEEGIQRARAEKPDLILLDITMPEKTGVKFYREIRSDPDLSKIPVVMVTGVMQEFQKFISTRKQVPPPDGYISKPVDQKLLLETVARLLGQN